MRNKKTEYVIILHGMGMNSLWMTRINHHLKKSGYSTINFNYPSTRTPANEIMEKHLKPVIDNLPADTTRLNFVTHSLGSIIVRNYFKEYSSPFPGRTVSLGPPNKGSEVADYLKNFWLYKWYFGDAGQVLTTAPDSFPNSMGPANFELGIIAGTCHWVHFATGPFMPKPNDGLVSVESSKLEGMKDHIEMNVNHTTMMFRKNVIDQTLYFLENGYFNRT